MRNPEKAVVAVLIVEDEFLLRMDAASSIEDAGFLVYEAENADEAIRMLELHATIRFVFTDVNMPGSMDGLKLAHYVRGRWPPIKIIVTSGLGHLREGRSCFRQKTISSRTHHPHIAGNAVLSRCNPHGWLLPRA